MKLRHEMLCIILINNFMSFKAIIENKKKNIGGEAWIDHATFKQGH